MIGRKLHDLIDVVSVSHQKLLDNKCQNSTDKRFLILKKVVHHKGINLEDLNELMDKEVRKIWPGSNEKEHNLKIRRLADFCIEQVEKVILESYLAKSSAARNIILANAVEKSGNLNLLNHYYDKAYVKSLEEEEMFYQMMGLKGKIRMNYASQSDKDLQEALHLNEEFIQVLDYTNHQKRTEYYNNISNVYLEKNSIVKDRRQKTNDEILEFLKEESHPVNRVFLYFSLAKLNYDDHKVRDHYFGKAKSMLGEIEVRNNAYYELDRRIRFLELRINFFTGKKLEELIRLSEEILGSGEGFSIINNNTLFYQILFQVLNNEVDKAVKMLEENHLYFKGTGVIMENFLKAVIAENKGDYKKAIQLLNPIMYSNQYFFAVFSRLLLIRIHLKRDNKALCKSLIASTQKFLAQNSNNPLGKEANEYVLQVLKKRIIATKENMNEVVLSAFHEYLLKV